MSQRRRAPRHTRTVAVEGHGDVRCYGLCVAHMALLYPAAADEPTVAEMAGPRLFDDKVPEELYLHPSFLRLIVGQTDLDVSDVERLCGEDRQRLVGGIYEAHPETRRIKRQVS